MSELDRPAGAIIGASSGVGRALAEELAARGWSLAVSARDKADLDALCAHLKTLHDAHYHSLPADLSAPSFDPESFISACTGKLGRIDALFVVAGEADPDGVGLGTDAGLMRLVSVNYLNALRLLRAGASVFEPSGRGLLVGISSIAAHSPRRRNMVYSSAKAGLEIYLRSLRHHFAGTSVLVQGYALGYVDTAMSFGVKLRLPSVSADAVARHIARNLHRDIGIVFLPSWWRWVVFGLNAMPWAIYKRLNF